MIVDWALTLFILQLFEPCHLSLLDLGDRLRLAELFDLSLKAVILVIIICKRSFIELPDETALLVLVGTGVLEDRLQVSASR